MELVTIVNEKYLLSEDISVEVKTLLSLSKHCRIEGESVLPVSELAGYNFVSFMQGSRLVEGYSVVFLEYILSSELGLDIHISEEEVG